MYYFLINPQFVAAQAQFSFANQYDFYSTANQAIQPIETITEQMKHQEPTMPGLPSQKANDPEKVMISGNKVPEKRSQGKQKIKVQTDEDFKPYEKTMSKSKKSKQKQDRNIIPNTIHHIIAFIQKRYKSGKIVARIFKTQSHNEEWNQNRYYIFQKILKSKINYYVNENALKILTIPGQLDFSEYPEDEQRFYCRISRILIMYFLKYEANCLILQSKKIKKQNIAEHLRVQRFLVDKMKVNEFY